MTSYELAIANINVLYLFDIENHFFLNPFKGKCLYPNTGKAEKAGEDEIKEKNESRAVLNQPEIERVM